ncbi:MAG: peptidoglycan-binding domain-containing protein, partial [Actinomycetota bacterium]|nr:peptidoglycan-binding domain-containing protein [Actinomycetota bacterium]
MKRRITIAAVVAAAIVAAVVAVANDSSDADSTVTATTEPREINTAVVANKDFVEDTEVGGTLGFGAVEALPNLASGIITWLPEPGTVVEFGDVLYEVDGRPVLLLEGDTPMYRTLNSRSSDGPDILQLEELLIDLGQADEGNLNVDDDFTSGTTDAIERWEQNLGITETGAVELGSIVYRTSEFRISAVNATVGQQLNGGSVLSFTSTERLVTVLLDTALAGLLEEQQVVEVELPDESTVAGTVTFVSNVAVTEGQGPNATSYIEVEIVLSGTGAAFDESPVTIRVEEILEEDATVVPIAALLALAEGGYAVEVVQSDGSTALVGVELGTFLDNEVAIFGNIDP